MHFVRDGLTFRSIHVIMNSDEKRAQKGGILMHGQIAVIFSDFKNDYNDGYVLGIQKQANLYGYKTFTFSMPQTSELYTNDEEWVFTLIDFEQYDGIIFVEHSFYAHKNLILPIEEALRSQTNCPVVVIGNSNTLPHVLRLENRERFERVAEHLIDVHGCRTLYCLGGDRNIEDERIDGFRNVMKRRGLPCGEQNVLYGGYWIPCAEALAKDIAYGAVEKPDAVLCVNDEIAYALIKKLFFFGLRVPEDLLVAGFDNSPHASNGAVSITTYAADTNHCGRRAVALLHSIITGCEVEDIPQKPQGLITGASCGCGTKPLLNIRAKLDALQKAETANMEFRNSRFEEKLYKVNSQEELSQFIKNHKYLIRDQISVSVNFMERDADEANCIYLKDYLINGECVAFRARDIYPDVFSFGAIKNVHVLPLVFDKEIFGFMTIGYSEENVYSLHAKQFANRIAIGAEILRVRQQAETEQLQVFPAAEPSADLLSANLDLKKSAAAVLVMHNGSMTKVPLENVLYFEAFEKRVFAALKSGKYEIKQRICELEDMLNGRQFIRISRSVLVNMNKVVGYKTSFDRTLLAVLSDKEELRVSRKHCEDFKKNLEEV